jgi:ABC-type glycerol-3-phosphate transport system substrate-binding protein
MKKLAVLLIVSMVFTSILAACGPTPEPQVVKETVVVTEKETVKETVIVTEKEEVEVTKVVKEEVEKVITATPEPEATPTPPPSGKIIVWGWEAALNDTIEASGVLDDFKEAYPDVEVEFLIMAPPDVYTNLPLALTAGEDLPDVVLVENSNLAQFVHLGGGTGLMDLTDKVAPYVDQMNDYKWTDCMLDGKYYCMPWDSGPVVMYYRRDVFDAAGLPSEPEEVTKLIATWDDYLEACETIKEETGAYCFAHNKANNWARLYEMVLWEQGLGYYDLETGNVTVDSPENIATLEMLGRFWEEDLVSDNLEWTDPWYAELGTVELSEGPIATIVEASWMEVFMKSWIAPGTAGLWGVAYMPSVTGAGPRTANDGGSTFVIPAEAPNPEAAWAFVEFTLGNRESQLKMFESSGFIPSLETTYDDELFETGDEFFAGQNARTIYADVVARIPSAGIYGPNYRMMNGSVSTAIQNYATGEMSAEEALQQAAEEIRANLE